MNSIQSLSDLRKLVDADTVDHIFTEYFMELVAKKNILDAVADVVHRSGTLQEVEALL